MKTVKINGCKLVTDVVMGPVNEGAKLSYVVKAYDETGRTIIHTTFTEDKNDLTKAAKDFKAYLAYATNVLAEGQKMKMIDKLKEAEKLVKSINSKKQNVWVAIDAVLLALDDAMYEVDGKEQK